MTAKSQNAPVTIVGTVLDHGPTVVVPVKVTNFVDIGAISLTMDYDFGIVQVTGVSPNENLPGFIADWTTLPGRLVMGWYGLPGVTLPDYSHLVDITFTGFVAGETDMTWINNGSSCEYAKYDDGEYNALNDIPTGDYYQDGQITYQRSGPQTVAPIYTSASDQVICIPIKVNQFTNIGAISLTLDYDPLILTFQGINSSAIPLTWELIAQAVDPGRLVVAGFGQGIPSLPDGEVLFNACFYYNGGTTLLEWYDANETACEYADWETLNPLFDEPQNVFYIDGVVTEIIHADFSADDLTPPKNTTVYFSDLSTGGIATTWNWSFSPNTVTFDNGTSAASQNPQVQFYEGGLYTVTLIASNAYTADSETKTDYIRAGIHGLWIGETSTDWLTSANWDDDLSPSNLSDVFITTSTSPTYWPKYTGSMVVGDDPGAQCKSITFEGSGYMLTIKGTLTTLSNLPESTIHAVSGTGNIKFETP